MTSLSDDKQTDIIDALGDILIIYINYFDNMESQIYPAELQPNKANTEASFLDLHLNIFNDSVYQNLQ